MAGQLTVTIVEARNLKDEDTVGGSNDAFVEVYVDRDYKQRTTTIQNSNNPQWNETFEFRLEKNDNHIHIKVYDSDGPLDRDEIGSAKIDLEPVKQRGSFDEWVKLPAHFGLKSHGEVNVRLNFRAT